MEVWALGDRRIRHEETGFTLAEVMVTIVILGILAGIAIPSWWSIVESRAVDSAANKLAADLRLAHSRSVNQLNDWAVVSKTTDIASVTGFSPAASPPAGDYYLIKVPSSGPIPLSKITARQLDEGGRTQIDSSTPVKMRFTPDGAVTITGPSTIQVHLKGKAYDSNPKHNIQVNSTTSRVKIDP
jgi:prepilin-type N-terminal cleavage/methylation domain-containing protein